MHGIGEPSSNSELGCEEDPDVLGPSSFPSSFPSFLNGTPCERNLSAGDGHPQIGEAALSGPSRLNQDLYICVCVCCALCVVCMYYRDIHYLPSCTRLASLQISVYFSWAESKTGAPPPEEPKSRSPHQSNVPLSRQRSHSRARTNMGALAPPHFYAASSSCRRPTRSALFPPTLSPRLRSSFLSLATVNVV